MQSPEKIESQEQREKIIEQRDILLERRLGLILFLNRNKKFIEQRGFKKEDDYNNAVVDIKLTDKRLDELAKQIEDINNTLGNSPKDVKLSWESSSAKEIIEEL